MRKILLTSILILSMNNITFANNEYSNSEYQNLLNNYIGEMRDETDIFDGSIYKALYKGLDEGYIIPNINRIEILSDSCKGIADNMKDIKIKDNNIQVMHNDLVNKYYELHQVLEVLLESKKELIYSDKPTTNKLIRLMQIDITIGHKVNGKIEELNNLYKDINKSLN